MSDPTTAEDRAVEALADALHAADVIHADSSGQPGEDHYTAMARFLRAAGFIQADEARASIAAAIEAQRPAFLAGLGRETPYIPQADAARIARETKLGAERTDR